MEFGRSRKAWRAFGRPVFFSGFTLIEIMIALALVAVLMAIAFPVARGITESQQRSRCAVNLQILGRHLLSLREDYQAFPRDRFEIAAGEYPGIGDVPAPHFPGIVGLYALHYLTEFAGEYKVSFAGVGTVDFSSGDKVVTGTGTTWVSADDQRLSPGDQILLNSNWYTVGSVESDVSLNLLEAPASSDTGASFDIQKFLTDQPGFSGGNYLRRLETLHCPADPIEQLKDAALSDPPLLRDLTLSVSDSYRSYNNYDLYYRRDWFHNPPYDETYYEATDPNRDKRNLVESAYPPADTLVTFCPYHRRSQDFAVGHPDRGDIDLVLFADGSVIVLPAYPYNAAAYDPETSSDPNPAEWFSWQRAEKEG